MPLPILVIIALIVLSLLVVVHEFGHFVAAKLVGVWPEEFGIGLPPRVWGKKIGDTIWSVNALPLGGFVRLHGEVGTDEQHYPERAFMNKSKLARAFIAVAGVAMNMAFAVLCFTTIIWFTGVARGVEVTDVVEGTAASQTEITAGDKIVQLGETQILDTSDFSPAIDKNKGKTTAVTVQKANGDTREYSVDIPSQAQEGKGLLGVGFKPSETYYGSGIERPFVAFKYGTAQTWEFTTLIFNEFGNLFKQIFSGQVPKGLAGPLGVVGVTAEAANQGFLPLLSLAGLISINLALINLVPFPPLDGSRVMFLVIEQIVGKKRLPKWEARIHAAGMYFLMGLMILLTAREVPKIFTAGSLTGFVESLIK